MYRYLLFLIVAFLTVSGINQANAQEEPLFKISTINEESTVNCLSDEVTIGVSIQNWVPGFEYVWSNGATDSVISVKVNTSRVFNLAIINQEIGFYNNRNFSIEFKNNPIVLDSEKFIVSNEFCPGSETPIEVNPSGGHGAYEYAWNIGNDTRTVVVAPLENTTYQVTVSDECGSESITNVYVELEEQNEIISPAKEITEFVCLNKELELAPSLEEVYGGVGYGYQYKFESMPTNTPITIEPENNAKYRVLVSDECGINWNTISLELKKNQAFIPDLKTLEVCAGSEVNVTYDESYNLYFWENNQLFSEKTKTIDKDVNIDLVFIDECDELQNVARSIKVDHANASWDYIASPYSDHVVLTAGEGQSAYKWSIDEKVIGTDREIEIELESGSETNVILETINENGCSETEERVVVKRTSLDIPTAFSPNNDGINDVYQLNLEEEFEHFSFKVFDRWGQLLYETNDQYFEWTADEIESNEQIQTFAFRLSGLTQSGNNIKESGTITIIKSKR